MEDTQIEYVGFVSQGSGREYTLRVHGRNRPDLTFTRLIPGAAFEAHRARYQDGPEICFLMLRKELSTPGEPPPLRAVVGDRELASYRDAHAPRPRRRKPGPPLADRNR